MKRPVVRLFANKRFLMFVGQVIVLLKRYCGVPGKFALTIERPVSEQ